MAGMTQRIPTPARLLAGLNGKQYVASIVAIAALVALFVGMWTWGSTPDYRVLYGNISERDGGAIIQSLQQMNVPYKFAEGGGALLVPADQVYEVRLRLASQGLPKGGQVGFELMENQKFGTSQFLEQVNYQRALEGELARSMETLSAVQGARVHLALPKPSVFVKEQTKPSASIVLSLAPGRTLDKGQISGIVHLIASSVPDMPARNVSVLDQSGTLLSANNDKSEAQLDANQISYVRQIEKDYIKRIEAIVEPLVGAGNVHAQVTADIDFSQTEQTAEVYKPNSDIKDNAVRSRQSLDYNNNQQDTGGVPGALTNQPPLPATAPITTPATTTQSATGAASSGSVAPGTRRESTVNFEVDRTISHIKLPVGNIKRLSAAVIVNHRLVTGKNGTVTSQPLTDAEKAEITALIKDTVGFDAKRGDTLSILNSAFTEMPAEPVGEIPFWQRPEFIPLAKDVVKYLLITILALILMFGVIRPAITRGVSRESRQESREGGEGETPDHLVSISEGAKNKAQAATQPTNTAYDQNLEAAKQLAQQDPKIVASVLKEWVNKE